METLCAEGVCGRGPHTPSAHKRSRESRGRSASGGAAIFGWWEKDACQAESLLPGVLTARSVQSASLLVYSEQGKRVDSFMKFASPSTKTQGGIYS